MASSRIHLNAQQPSPGHVVQNQMLLSLCAHMMCCGVFRWQPWSADGMSQSLLANCKGQDLFLTHWLAQQIEESTTKIVLKCIRTPTDFYRCLTYAGRH